MVIIPEICITQVSGIIRTFAADMRKIVLSIIMLAMTAVTSDAQNVQDKATKTCSLQLVNEWDKTNFWFSDWPKGNLRNGASPPYRKKPATS